jgi:hypothetical protein
MGCVPKNWPVAKMTRCVVADFHLIMSIEIHAGQIKNFRIIK